MIFIFIAVYLVLTFMLSWKDLQTGLLPDYLTCPLLWSGLLYQLWLQPDNLPSAVAGAMAGYITLATIYWGYRWLKGKEGLGYGDIKLLAALGAWHSIHALPALLLLASLCGLSAVLWKIYAAPIEQKTQLLTSALPFGPCLTGAGVIISWFTFKPSVELTFSPLL